MQKKIRPFPNYPLHTKTHQGKYLNCNSMKLQHVSAINYMYNLIDKRFDPMRCCSKFLNGLLKKFNNPRPQKQLLIDLKNKWREF